MKKINGFTLNNSIVFIISMLLILSTGSCDITQLLDQFRNQTNTSVQKVIKPQQGLLPVGFKLEKGQIIHTFNGQYNLQIQGDGNLVLYQGIYPRWSSGTVNSGAYRFIAQGDGNLVLYRKDGKSVWDSRTHGHPGARLALQEDGNLVLYHNGSAIWSTGTYAVSNYKAAIAGRDYSGNSSVNNARIITDHYPGEDIIVIDFDAVADFNADPSGIRDSTKAIQRALNQCHNSGGGTVWLPRGRYKITNSINVPAFCTLKGDWNDPDNVNGSGEYGTILMAYLPQGINGPNLLTVGGSAGVNGLTIFYPHQNMENLKQYNYVINIPGRGVNYMMSSVINVTLLNAYQGISISTRYLGKDKNGKDQYEIHETSTVKNVKGTVLYRGMTAYNGADVSVWQNIRLSNEYWADAGEDFNAPGLKSLNSWTKSNGKGFVLGDVEWDQFLNIEINSYDIGIHIVHGHRIKFTGSFVDVRVNNSTIGIRVDELDERWGAGFVACKFEGTRYSAVNNSNGYLKFNHTELKGPIAGSGQIIVKRVPGAAPPAYQEPPKNKVTREVLYNVTKSPFNAPRVIPNREGVIPVTDATGAIQHALNRAGSEGGGVVYFPPGWYRVNGTLVVPPNVEIRGASSTPHRDQLPMSKGSVLFVHNGHNYGNNAHLADSAPACITLNGNRSGVVGIRFFYPNNRPDKGIVPYPFAIRGIGRDHYIRNVNFSNAWNGIDFMSHVNENHVIDRVVGTVFHRVVLVGGNKKGWITNLLTNGNAVLRNGYMIHNWIISHEEVFQKVIDPVTRKTEILVVTKNTGDEYIANIFGYGVRMGIEHQGGLAKVFNIGTDNLGNGYTIYSSDTIYVLNAMRYNGKGTTYSTNGAWIAIYNDNIIH